MKLFGNELMFNDNKIYHQGDKPTPAEIGAAPSSHTHTYAGSTSTGGSANSAVKLATSRTINGTSFDGSANITTSKWGTARTITIGNSTKTIDGSGNITWTLSEIGVNSNTSGNYLPLSGGTLTGNLNIELSNGGASKINVYRTLNSNRMEGSFDVYAYGSGAAALSTNNKTTGLQESCYVFGKNSMFAETSADGIIPSLGNTGSRFNGLYTTSIDVSNTNFGPVTITRGGGSTEGAGMAFANTNGILGYIGMTGTADGGLRRYKADKSTSYVVVDSGNLSSYALPISGGTVTGDLRLKSSSSNYGNKLYFGDGSYCYFHEDSDDHLYLYAAKGFNVKTSSTSYSLNLTGSTGLGDLNTNYSGMLVFGSSLQLNAGSSAVSLLGGYVASYCDMSPGSNGGYSLGMSSYRWKEVYCTRGAFNGSDMRLKEDIKVIPRNNNMLKAKDSASVTSEDLYNYVKNTNTYTFRYRNTDNENFIGVLANEIPDNIFSLIGRMSNEDEESQRQVEDSLKAKEIYKVALEEGKYESMETMNTINEELGMSYAVIRDLANRETESEPMKLINAPAQVAMLQEVLSMALNKIENLESRLSILE